MKKIIFTLAALTALSTASFAERNWDLRDSPEAQGSFSTPADRADSTKRSSLMLHHLPAIILA